MGKKLGVPICNLTKNRCFDENVLKKSIKDNNHTSEINLIYTEHARQNLIKEHTSTDY